MTAEDLYESKTGNKAYGYANIPSVEYVEWLERDYPIYISEQAMTETAKEYKFTTSMEASAATNFGNEALSRIKQLTEE